MVSVAPVSLRFVRPEWCREVVSPPHDALSAEARRRHLLDHPRSYLGVTRSPDDIDPPESGPDDRTARAVELSRASLESLLADGAFGEVRPPGLYLYRLIQGDHQQTGLVCGVATADYDAGLVRIHEQINQARADLLARHLRAVGAQSSPIALAFRRAPAVEALIERIVATGEPLLDLVEPDLRQTLWAVDERDHAAAIADLVDQPLYLIDGHHRAAAASADRRDNGLGPGSPDEHTMLSVLFPLSQLDNEAFHRVLDGVDPDDLLRRLADRYPLREARSIDEVVDRPEGWIAIAAGSPILRWWLVELPPPNPVDGHVVDIEPIRLGQHVLTPLLGIEEPTPDPRLSYRPGPADAVAASHLRLERGQVEFWMRPVPLTTLSDMADQGQVMPPKSTYFEPKVRSGLFIRLTDPSLGPVTA